jgi:hypothetical protein
LLIWCSATSRALARHRVDSQKRAPSIGGTTFSDAAAGENSRRAAALRGHSILGTFQLRQAEQANLAENLVPFIDRIAQKI